MRDKLKARIETSFQVLKDVMIVMGKRMYLPDDKTLKNEVLKEEHESRFAIHLGSTNMYRDLNEYYRWQNMKKEVVEYVSKYDIYQQVKVEHQKPAGPLQLLLIPKWK